MMSLSALVVFLAASGSLASPLKVRSPKEIEVYEYNTVVDVVTVAAPVITDIVVADVIVAGPPVVDVVTVTITPGAEPETTPEITSTVEHITSIDQNTASLDTLDHENVIITAAPSIVVVVQTVQETDAPSPTAIQVDSVNHKPKSSSAPQPPKTSTKPSPTADNLPTNSIVYDLQPTDSTYADLVVFSHNVHRQNHTNTNNLVYNDTLASYAKEKSESCIWDEELPADATAANVGMNMAEGTYIGAANITAIVSDMWYNDELSIFPGFDQANPDMSKFDLWGHFTQVVWRDTTSVGCWSSSCSRNDGTANEIGSGFFTVCTYWPPANFPGQYATQVGDPEGHPTVAGV